MNIYEFGKFIKDGGGTGGKKLVDVAAENPEIIPKVPTKKGKYSPTDLGLFNIEKAQSDLKSAFSYEHTIISPNGIYERTGDGQIQYMEGLPMGPVLPADPFKQSIGSDVVYNTSPVPNISFAVGNLNLARLTEDLNYMPAGLYTGNSEITPLPPFLEFKKKYAVPYNYRPFMDFIEFSEPKIVEDSSPTSFTGTVKRQHSLVYGTVPLQVNNFNVVYPQRFAKLKLLFLSMMMSLKEKTDGFSYRFPMVGPPDQVNKLLKTLGKHPGAFKFAQTIDSTSDYFLLSTINEDSQEYQRHLYAIGYQLLVGTTGFIPKGIEYKSFQHCRFSAPIPLSEEVSPILSSEGIVNSSNIIADIVPVYNYQVAFWEEALELIPEIRIPNVYRMITDEGNSLENPGATYVLPVDKDAESDPSEGNHELSFYESIANRFINCDEDEETVYADSNYNSMMNVVIDPFFFKGKSVQNGVQFLKDFLPMYVEVSFDTEGRTAEDSNLLNVLNNTNVIKHFVQSYIHNNGPKANASMIVKQKTGGDTDSGMTSPEALADKYNFFAVQQSVFKVSKFDIVTALKDSTEFELFDPDYDRTVIGDALVVDFEEWFKLYANIAKGAVQGSGENDTKMLLPGEDSKVLFTPLEQNQVTSDFTYYLRGENAPIDFDIENDTPSGIVPFIPPVQSNLKSYFENNTPAFSRINSLAPCKSLTLFYEVKKYDEDNNNIQNFFIINHRDQQKINYVDTQVKYGRRYRYEITAHKLVIGADYKIRFENTNETDQLATTRGYGKKLSLDIIYSAIKNSNNKKVGDFFNSKFVEASAGTFSGFDNPEGFTDLNQLVNSLALPTNLAALNQSPDNLNFTDNDYYFDPDVGTTPIQSVVADDILTYRAYTKTHDPLEEPTSSKQFKFEGVGFADEVGNRDPGFDQNYPLFAGLGPNPSPIIGGVDSDGYCNTDDIPSDNQAVDETQKLFIFTVDCSPMPLVSKVPFYSESSVEILDDPPIFPNVNFLPLANEKNRLLITFENQTGHKEEKPIILMKQDEVVFDHVRINQKRLYTYPDGSYFYPQLRFKSDDFPSEYQVFRLENQKPQSYNDFYGRLHRVLDVSQETAFYTNLQTNVKYYYTFRSVDRHNKLSNPGPVYEVEMVEDGGTIYPLINVIEIKPPETKKKSKKFSRFLKIEAAYAQKILNKQKSNIGDDGTFKENFKPELGLLEQSLWNQRKFKFRIKSKNSCKAIDLNINFVTKYTDTDDGSKSCN